MRPRLGREISFSPVGYAAFIASMVLALSAPRPAAALRFRVQEVGNRKLLWVYDCKRKDPIDGSSCESYEAGFNVSGDGYAGDPVVFHAYLERARISEVVVFSGGGIVNAAIPMARDLRAHRLAIRVPKGTACVSSCTIFFMGGTIRTIEKGATYEVHSASSWQSGIDEMTHEILPPVRMVADNPDNKLREFVQEEQVDSRERALQLLRLFQNTLILSTGRSQEPEDDRDIADEADHDLPPLDYLNSEALRRDVRRIHAEGVAAVQDIMMRLEREQMGSAIHWLEGRTDLGYRAAPALEMVRMMYMESIRETSTLSESELERRGYVTPQLR